jgi:hypothetical protein
MFSAFKTGRIARSYRRSGDETALAHCDERSFMPIHAYDDRVDFAAG